ncbi:MAG: hypothetical protein M3437_11425 [Chloroflexota bacterium]|nr:hypothetical protein [Chloroflexota bacterium]MDQ5865681.1 hypothetical protein [Chloroflexota bacterium]
MASKDLTDIIKQAETLSPQELLQLISHLADRVRQAYSLSSDGRQWQEIAGAAPYPLLGEDAQVVISQTRSESDQNRKPSGSGDS